MQTLARSLFDWRVTIAHQRAYRSRRHIENIDLVLIDDLPDAARIGPIRQAFVHDDGCAIREWSIDDVTMPRDPANVCGAPVDIPVVVIEYVAMRNRCV